MSKHVTSSSIKVTLDGYPAWLSKNEVAAILHMGLRSVSRLVAARRLVASKITRSSGPGGRVLIDRASLERLITSGLDAV
jgi:hypothetical protein